MLNPEVFVRQKSVFTYSVVFRFEETPYNESSSAGVSTIDIRNQ